jgi:hypothetical protein
MYNWWSPTLNLPFTGRWLVCVAAAWAAGEEEEVLVWLG